MTAGKDEGVKIGGMSLLGAGFDSPEEPPGAETVLAAFPHFLDRPGPYLHVPF